MPIITSILDTDLYKLTMQRAVLDYCPGVNVKYVFNNRRPEGRFTERFMDRLQFEVKEMGQLRLTTEESNFLHKSCPFVGREYLGYLANFRLTPEHVQTELKDEELRLQIEGSWEETILWEVPLMAIISQVYFEVCDTEWKFDRIEQLQKIRNKGRKLVGYKHADFGSRRRRSFETQDLVVKTLKDNVGFVGTSNVLLAMMHDVRPLGTMAHEWIMGISALEGLRHANRHAMRAWSQVYKGWLGTALPDTFGSEAFFGDFDHYLARLFDGVRHDSGEPLKFTDKVVAHYKSLGIDPMTKTIIFSDGLDVHEATRIAIYCYNKIGCSFGIGTNFTNDFEGSKPLNMVIKLAECNVVPVVKLSDTPTKAIGDKDALRVAKWTFLGTPLDAA